MGVCRQSKENELSDSAVVPQSHLEKSSLETKKKRNRGCFQQNSRVWSAKLLFYRNNKTRQKLSGLTFLVLWETTKGAQQPSKH